MLTMQQEEYKDTHTSQVCNAASAACAALSEPLPTMWIHKRSVDVLFVLVCYANHCFCTVACAAFK